MTRLVVTTFLSLDGVMQGPGGPDEDQSDGFDLGGWLAPYFDDDGAEMVAEMFAQADGFLLGRRTYEIFSAYWPRKTDPKDPVAGPLNRLPKYVASTTLTSATWEPTTLLREDVPGAIRRLKAEVGRELQVHGSGGLAQTLFREDLVDELRLWWFPVVLGRGKRLFADGAAPAAFRLADARTTASGVCVHRYERAGALETGSMVRDE